MDFHDSGPGPEGAISSVVAADGRVFFTDYQGRLFTYFLNEEQATFDERCRVTDAGRPGSFGAPDRLAVLTPYEWVPYEYGGRRYWNKTTSVAHYRVGPDGALSLVSALPTINTGAIDDMHAIADFCAREGLWFHVDGAIGAVAVLADNVRADLAGMERADSIALDLHKWMHIRSKRAA